MGKHKLLMIATRFWRCRGNRADRQKAPLPGSKAILRIAQCSVMTLLLTALLACATQPLPQPTVALTLPPPPTSTPEPTSGPTPVPPTYTPRPAPNSSGDDPANHSEAFIGTEINVLLKQFLDAIMAEPEADIPAALETFRQDCRENAAALLQDVDVLRGMFAGTEVGANVVQVSKVQADQAVVLIQLLVDGAPAAPPVRYLYLYEDARWLDSQCPGG